MMKYRNEADEVRNHIHLMAIQKMVYLKLHRKDMLDMIDNSYRNNQGPVYRRAWQIVNDIEGDHKVIQDIIASLNRT